VVDALLSTIEQKIDRGVMHAASERDLGQVSSATIHQLGKLVAAKVCTPALNVESFPFFANHLCSGKLWRQRDGQSCPGRSIRSTTPKQTMYRKSQGGALCAIESCTLEMIGISHSAPHR
jgi:hypothetical protein